MAEEKQFDYRKYLKPEIVSKLKNMSLRARLVVEGFITGLHRSPYHGFSVEFSLNLELTVFIAISIYEIKLKVKPIIHKAANIIFLDFCCINNYLLHF